MTVLVTLAIGLLAGVLGAILGLGGGVVVVPALEFALPQLGHPVTIQQAVAISQFSVLAVGLSGAAAYLQQGLVRARTGYLLSPYTIVGGTVGSVLGLVLPAKVVATVLSDPELRQLWEEELAGMRNRIKAMRQGLRDGLTTARPEVDWSYITTQNGMFSYSGLSADTMAKLRSEHGIYGLDSGRICVAALNEGNLPKVVAAIAALA